jgi:hypothetical protein
MALIVEADLVARIGPLNEAQSERVDGLVEDATAEILEYADRYSEPVAGDVVTLRGIGRRITLPRTPVSAVNSVTAIGVTGDRVLQSDDWHFDGIDKIDISLGAGVGLAQVPADGDPSTWTGTGTYIVDYDHGVSPTPAIIKAVAAGMVNRVLTAPTLAEGLTQETIGQYGYQTQQGTGSQGTQVRLTKTDERRLKRWHTSSGTVSTPVR